MLLGALTPDTLCQTSAAGSYLAPPLIDFPHKIISEPDDVKRAVLIVVADIARRALTVALHTLGIEVPEKM